MNSLAEEDHLKAIYKETERTGKGASTNAIALRVNSKASSVTDMVKKLAEKGLVDHKPYHGVTLTESGQMVARLLLRKHRLWETFLVNNLRFRWDEVHQIAEQLEHIRSKELIDRLDDHLGNPKFDPHGDPIPDRDGKITERKDTKRLSELPKETMAQLVGLEDSSDEFLKFLDGIGLRMGTQITVMRRFDYDESMEVSTHFRNGITLSKRASEDLLVKEL